MARLSRVRAHAGPLAAVSLIVAVSALLARVGSDAQWLAAMGDVILRRHTIPAGVPFAATPTAHWPNALVLAEIVFGLVERGLGDRGLMLAQLLAVGVGFTVLTRDARRGGAGEGGTAAALALAALGALGSLAIARVQLFSLVMFPLLAGLLRSEVRDGPSRRIWLVVPLLALWSNLHGAALLGLGVVLVYLATQRGRSAPLQSLAVGLAACVALCLTPALARTPDYYVGVMTNAAAQRGAGMWGPLSLSDPLDVLLALVAAVLVVRIVRARPPAWEWIVVGALALATIRADRNGVWLLFFLTPRAARALAPRPARRGLAPAAAAAALILVVIALARGPAPVGAPTSLVRGAVALAHGSPVLADGTIDEQVALAGGRIWAGNPIDAFSRPVQNAYLSWVAGEASGRSALAPSVSVVIVTRGSQAQSLMARMAQFTPAAQDTAAILYRRRSALEDAAAPASRRRGAAG